ncbi:MAG TPA: zf-HC2 domain-containing protein [Myxococcales bacterium]|jgi:hypothetical protein|nr:zf-HC2 domain-containing protein [Myxococcales bacterium]
MAAACVELESLILDWAAGTLASSEAAALQAHLDGCGRCRAWASVCQEAVQLAALPPQSEAELRVLAQLPARARAAFRERRRRSRWGRPLLAASLGAAAVSAALLVAAPRWRAASVPPAPEGEESELVAWALSDPLDDAAAVADPDEDADEESLEQGPEMDLEWEQTE